MIASQPPRTIESLLASLGADTDFRDGVIGDLAEEFAQRADLDGASAARRWYYREAARATPHMLYSSLRHMGMKGVWHRLGIVASAYSITLFTTLLPMSIVVSFAKRLGVPIAGAWMHILASTSGVLGVLLFDIAQATFGGWVAASLDSETPLIGAGMLGVLWVSLLLALEATAQTVWHPAPPVLPVPLWYRSIVIMLIPICTTAGGILRVRSRAPIAEERVASA